MTKRETQEETAPHAPNDHHFILASLIQNFSPLPDEKVHIGCSHSDTDNTDWYSLVGSRKGEESTIRVQLEQSWIGVFAQGNMCI